MIIEEKYIKDIIHLYTKDKKSLRNIADKFQTNHHVIKRILMSQGITINRRNQIYITSEETKKKLSQKRIELLKTGWKPYWKGKNIKGNSKYIDMLLKNMKAHLKYDVSLEWLKQFDDIEKLKFLNKSISRSRDYLGFDTKLYQKFIFKFYNDEQFNKIYNKWKKRKEKYLRPSLDHIIPKSKGGKLTDLNNLQFITWFENKAKSDLNYEEWQKIKKNIKDYLI